MYYPTTYYVYHISSMYLKQCWVHVRICTRKMLIAIKKRKELQSFTSYATKVNIMHPPPLGKNLFSDTQCLEERKHKTHLSQ